MHETFEDELSGEDVSSDEVSYQKVNAKKKTDGRQNNSRYKWRSRNFSWIMTLINMYDYFQLIHTEKYSLPRLWF